ncbi:6766_t:CDS:2 [Acaulospora morrowiae]|uniref:6766_t:CDS:1 n=1 Tax=Acaulospora morrowiae TaxID=94023 RepID=A0A9N9D574_9GLOM|nr:6766_t:CDS:2 [Acaulospora morrowiae]
MKSLQSIIFLIRLLIFYHTTITPILTTSTSTSNSDFSPTAAVPQCIDYSDPLDFGKHIIKPCPNKARLKGSNTNFQNDLSSGNSSNMFVLQFTCGETNTTLCKKAKSAFEAAGKIITAAFIFKAPIVIDANFLDLNDPRLLGAASPTRLMPIVSEDSVPRMYPQALVKQFQYSVHPDYSPTDILAKFNSGADFWFQGDGPIGPQQSNFHTVILHELFHGLGFSSSYRDYFDLLLGQPSEGITAFPMLDSNSTNPTFNDPLKFSGFIETIFDKFIMILPDKSDPSGTKPLPISYFTNQLNQFGPLNTIFPNINVLTSQIMGSPQWKSVAQYLIKKATVANTFVFVPRGGTLANATYLETNLKVYSSGSSISHVSLAKYTNTNDFLMRYSLESGVTIEDLIIKGGNYSGGAIGPRLRAIMNSIG